VNENQQNGDSGKPIDPVVSAKRKSRGNQTSHRTDSEGAIGAGLRSLYQDIVKEPLPDDIMALLNQLGSIDSDEK
jgi:Anti-sigma factor NepR